MIVWLIVLVAAVEGQTSNKDPSTQPASYMILHPNYYSYDAPFNVYVRMLRHVTSETITATLIYENMTSKTNVTIASGSTTLTSGTTDGKITLQIPEASDKDRTWRMYWLHVNGTGSVTFSNVSSVRRTYRQREVKGHVFVQTDRGEYKTGQKVLYRVFVLDKDLKPIDPAMYIRIKDGKGNVITEHTDVRAMLGFSGELQLSERPVIGNWLIEVKVKELDLTHDTPFYVREYVLPKYEVRVELPPYGLVGSPELKGKVIAKYTYGKPVKGDVTLKVTKNNAYWRFYEPRAIQTKFEIDGEAEFSIPMDTLLKFDPSLRYDTLAVSANVTEALTGTARIATGSVTFHESTIRLELDGTREFKPGFRYTTYLKVVQPDGRPIASYGEQVRISVTYFTDRPVSFRFQQQTAPRSPTANLIEFLAPFPGGNVIFMPDMRVPLPRDGTVKIDLDVPDGVATGHIEVEAMKQKTTKNIQRFRTLSNAYLNLELKSENLKVGDKAEFAISSTVTPSERITFYVINEQSEIILTDYVTVQSKYRQSRFHVTMTTDMVPGCNVIAFFYHGAQEEVIADGVNFQVSMSLMNKVALEFDRHQVSPGTNVSVHVNTDPGSQVFVLAVDKSSILNRKGNDITTRSVYEQIGIYKTVLRDQRRGSRMGGNDVKDLFQSAGLEVLTDSNMYDFSLWSLLKRSNERYSSGQFSYNSMACNGPGCSMDMTESSLTQGPAVRKDFPETWLWTNHSASSSGRVDIYAEVPDTITGWVATAFALNKDSGLGAVSQPSNLTVFLPFFVSLHLPFSIVSGEVAVIQALVFNYYPYDMYVTVTLKNSSADFTTVTVSHYGKEEEVNDVVENCVLVKSDSATSTYFMIKPTTVGTLDLEVEARSTRGQDTVRRQLVVKPPGKEEEENHAILVSLDKAGGSLDTEISVFFPPRIVPDSQRVRLTVIGDIFGPSLENLDHLVQMPHGCGEQNMVNFAPAVFAARYMNVTDRYNDRIKERTMRAMNTGYQRQLSFQKINGSFCTFDTQPGSLWLTTFVVKSFSQASQHIFIDPDVMERAVNFTLNHQNPDGSFNRVGFVYSKTLQGATAATNRSLAAYILIALMETQKAEILTNATLVERLRKGILSTWSYLYQSREQMTDDYEMAISAYALGLMGRGGSNLLLEKLDGSRNAVKNDGMLYWRDSVTSKQVEMASYVLLAHAQNRDKQAGLPVLRWLVKQRNPFGGFISTQDTVVALQALSEFAVLMYNKDVDVNVTFATAFSEKPESVNVNSDNMDVMQIVDVPSEQGRISVNASGYGNALIEASIFYNVLAERTNPSFRLTVTTAGKDLESFTVKVCTRWLGSEDSGMVVIETEIPSGYEVDQDRNILLGSTFLYNKPFEVTGRRHVEYVNNMVPDSETCVLVRANRVTTVARYQPAYVHVYSYYDTEKSAMTMYLPSALKGSSICDVCGVECGCKYDPEAVPQSKCASTSSRQVVSPYKSIERLIQVPARTIVYPNPYDKNRLASYPSWTRRRTVRVGHPWMPQNLPLVRRVWTSREG